MLRLQAHTQVSERAFCSGEGLEEHSLWTPLAEVSLAGPQGCGATLGSPPPHVLGIQTFYFPFSWLRASNKSCKLGQPVVFFPWSARGSCRVFSPEPKGRYRRIAPHDSGSLETHTLTPNSPPLLKASTCLRLWGPPKSKVWRQVVLGAPA